MKVAIDRGPLLSGHSVRGIGVHTRELLRVAKILATDKLDIQAVDFSRTDLSNYDLVHYQHFNPFFLTLPSKKPAKKVVVTIHDLIPLIYPKHYPPGLRGRLRYIIQKMRLKKVDAVITISQTSKKDIIKFLGIPAKRVHVIYLAPKKIFKVVTDEVTQSDIRKKYKLPQKFVLYVGDINYNKNIPSLIEACRKLALPLVIAGKKALDIEGKGMELMDIHGPKDWLRFIFDIPHPELAHYQGLLDEFRGNKQIIRLGFVPDKDLTAVFNLALVYVQPSYYEGFGLTVLEAMACGTPVVASDIGAHREIANGVVAFANPLGPKDIARQMTRIIDNRQFRDSLIKKGLEKAREFSWERTAKETIELYEEILARD